jgi:hypothetical protein
MTYRIEAPTDAGFQPIQNLYLPSTVQNHPLGQEVIATDPVLGSGEFIYLAGPASSIAGQTISSITVAAGVATMTTGAGHSLKVGDLILITGSTPSAFNGTFTVLSVPSGTTLTFALNTALAYVGSGSYVASAITAGDTVTITPTLVSGAIVMTANRWAGTANSGVPLAVAMTSLFGGCYGWFQVSGAAIVQVSASPTAGNSAYWQSANGVISSTVVASKQVLNSMFLTASGVTLGSGSTAIVLDALRAVLDIKRPFAQGAIT